MDEPIPLFLTLTSDRVEHYDGVINHMTQIEVNRFAKENGFYPSESQVAFYKKELCRLMTIGRRIDDAQKVKIPKSNILLETK